MLRASTGSRECGTPPGSSPLFGTNNLKHSKICALFHAYDLHGPRGCGAPPGSSPLFGTNDLERLILKRDVFCPESVYLIWLTLVLCVPIIRPLVVAGWSSLVARRAHNP